MRKLLLALLPLALASSVGAQSCCDFDTVLESGPFVWGAWMSNNSAPGETTVTLDTASEGHYWIVQAPKTGSITAFKFGTGTVTTGATMDCRVEDVTAATGVPTGNLWAADTSGTIAVVSGGSDNGVEKTCTLTAAASVTKGQFVAFKVAQPSAAAGNMTVVVSINSSSWTSQVPYTANNTTGSYVLAITAGPLALSLLYSDGKYYSTPSVWAVFNAGETAFSEASTPDEVGNVCTMPFSAWMTGIRQTRYDNDDYSVVVYDAGSNVLGTINVDGSLSVSAASRSADYVLPSDIFLGRGQTYRFVLKAGAASVGIANLESGSEAQRQSLPGGKFCQYTSRSDSGAWSETATKLVNIFPILR